MTVDCQFSIRTCRVAHAGIHCSLARRSINIWYAMCCLQRLVPVEGQNGVLTAMLAPASSPQPGPYRLSAMRGHSAVILVWMLLNGVSVQGQCPTVGGPSSNAIQCTFGTPVDSCPAAYPQRSGLLCYERCPDGMSGDIGVCKMNCPR